MKVSRSLKRLKLRGLLTLLFLLLIIPYVVKREASNSQPTSPTPSPNRIQPLDSPTDASFSYKDFLSILDSAGFAFPERYDAVLSLSPEDYHRWKEGNISIPDSVQRGTGLHEDLNNDGILDRFLPLQVSGSRAFVVILYGQRTGGWKRANGSLCVDDDDAAWIWDENDMRRSAYELQTFLLTKGANRDNPNNE